MHFLKTFCIEDKGYEISSLGLHFLDKIGFFPFLGKPWVIQYDTTHKSWLAIYKPSHQPQ